MGYLWIPFILFVFKGLGVIMKIDDERVIQLIETTAVNSANIAAINKEIVTMRSDMKNEMGDMRGDVRDMLERSYDSKMGISSLKTKITIYSGVVSIVFTILVTTVVGKV